MAAHVRPLRITETGGRVRLALDGFAPAEGESLQEAADELVHRLLVVAMAFRHGGVGPCCSEAAPDLALLDFVWQVGEIAASGGDVRDFLFGPNPLAA